MGKMKNIYYLFTVLICAYVVGCTDDFETINENPNAPQSVSPEFLLTNVIVSEINENTYNQGLRLNNYMTQFVASVEFERIDRYELGGNSGYWNLIYGLLADLESMKELDGYNEAYDGVATIMRSYLFSQLTDLWGDVPYTEAVAFGELNFTPAYDSQEFIYSDPENGILAQLEDAVEQLQNTTESVQGDVLFGNDLNKWVRFSNTLQVRYLLRTSKKSTDFSKLQELADSAMLMRSNEDNAVLPYLSAAPNQFPLFNAALGIYQELRMTETVDSVLKLWDDPRIAVFYKPSNASVNAGNPEYKGLLNGQSRETISAAGTDLNDISLMADTFRAVPDGVDAQLMLYSELQFALAEAVERGYITGDAEQYYQNGIQAHFEYYNAELPAGYFTRDAIALNGNQEDNLQKILTQKWLSLFMVGHEAWFNIRRTGIPALKPGPDNLNNGQYPSRYLYPESEQAANKANYDAAIARMGADNINTKVWWEKE